MSLTKDDVKKVAKLANLPLTVEEEEKYTNQLSKILEYVEQLEKVDTSNIDPTFNISGQSNIAQEDKVGTCLPQQDALKNASNKNEHFFVTKGVFNNE
jgi:aspartyl-tRNA(Asn)/glutamyl-tRNA(Gln) amidotransferase subunit C